MATAMAFPDPAKLKRKAMFPEETSDAGFNKATLSKARYVLRNSPMVDGDRYPRRCFPHGQFLPWIAAEFEMSDQSARQFMWVYDRFGDENQKIFEFRPSVIYALSAPSTPDSVLAQSVRK